MPWTPLWNSTDDELIAAARSLDNPSALLTELAERLAERSDTVQYLEEYEAVDLTPEEMRALEGALIEGAENTVHLLQVLAQANIDHPADLRAALKTKENANVA